MPDTHPQKGHDGPRSPFWRAGGLAGFVLSIGGYLGIGGTSRLMLVGASLLENWQNDPCGAMLPTPIEPSILASPMPSDTMEVVLVSIQ